MAYFAQVSLDVACVAMVTASHNENGWTGVRMGRPPAMTFGPEEIGQPRRDRAFGRLSRAAGRSSDRIEGMAERYIADAASRVRLSRPLKVVAACGNGTAGPSRRRACPANGRPAKSSRWTAKL